MEGRTSAIVGPVEVTWVTDTASKATAFDSKYGRYPTGTAVKPVDRQIATDLGNFDSCLRNRMLQPTGRKPP